MAFQDLPQKQTYIPSTHKTHPPKTQKTNSKHTYTLQTNHPPKIQKTNSKYTYMLHTHRPLKTPKKPTPNTPRYYTKDHPPKTQTKELQSHAHTQPTTLDQKQTNKQPKLELTALQMILSKNPEIIKQKIEKECFVLPRSIKYLLQGFFVCN